jgi:hypothetical protein
MTALQIQEFQKLEMAYLDSLHDNDGSRQIEVMELIFFWLRKQLRFAVSEIAVLSGTFDIEVVVVSEVQKQEFTFLQMAMIKAVGRDDRSAAVGVELKMREWFDKQITDAISRAIKPDLKIIRDYKN